MAKKNEEKINVQLQDRDKQIILDCCKYKGLPNKSISAKYFNSQKSCNGRLLKLEKAGYLKKTYHVEKNGKGLLIGPKRTAVYYATYKGQKAVEYKINTMRYEKLIPIKDNLDKQLLLGKIYEAVPNLIPSTEARVNYGINNSVPILCVIPSTKLMVISVLGKTDNSKTRKHNNLKYMIQNNAIKTDDPVMNIIIAPAFPKLFIHFDVFYLQWSIAPAVIKNINNDINYYKRSFQQSLISSGYTAVNKDNLYWQVTNGNQTFNISELITGSTLLMRSLKQPPENAYIYVYSRSNLNSVSLEQGFSFLIFSWKDKKTFRVNPKPDGRLHFSVISKGLLQ